MRFEQLTFLVVDDSADDLRLIEAAFVKVGVTNPIVCKINAEDACAFLNGAGADGEQRPVVLMTDLKMPGMDGVELVRWVRTQPGWKGMPVVMLSGSILDTDAIRAYEAGVNIFLSKAGSLLDHAAMLRSLVAWLRLNHDLP